MNNGAIVDGSGQLARGIDDEFPASVVEDLESVQATALVVATQQVENSQLRKIWHKIDLVELTSILILLVDAHIRRVIARHWPRPLSMAELKGFCRRPHRGCLAGRIGPS